MYLNPIPMLLGWLSWIIDWEEKCDFPPMDVLGSLLSHGALAIVRSPNRSEDIIRRRIIKPIFTLLGLQTQPTFLKTKDISILTLPIEALPNKS